MSLPGLDQVLAQFDEKTLKEAYKKALAKYGNAVVRDAKRLCPVDNGFLRASINADLGNLDDLEIDITVGANYAAYVEFGTGPYAARQVGQYDEEWQAYAKQFYINGEGKAPAQPFLYPAVEKNVETFEKELIKALSK